MKTPDFFLSMKENYRILLALFFCTIVVLTTTAYAVEHYYYAFIFPAIRSIYALTLYYLPMAAIYIVVPVFVFWVYWQWKKRIAHLSSAVVKIIVFPIVVFLFIYCWFYLSWGLLYKAPNLSSRLHFSEVQIDSTYLINEIRWVENKMRSCRKTFWENDTIAIPVNLKPRQLESLLQSDVASTLENWNIKSYKNVRVRPLYPAGSLLIFSTAGIYLPFSGEGHYDPGLAHFHAPFVMAHELGHANGITGEADCNFIAMITCLRSENTFVQYAGLLTYWRYLNADLRRSAIFSYYQIAFARPIFIRKDLNVLYKALDRYPELMPVIRDKIYDTYLKANGLKDGLMNYDKILLMFKAWKESSLDPDIKQKWGI